MKPIAGVVFQEPGRSPQDTTGGQRESVAASANHATEPPTTRDAAEQAGHQTAGHHEVTNPQPPARKPGPAVKARQKRDQRVFPVEVLAPHPLALECARRLIEENPSYTTIRPGDTPGSLIVR